MLLKYKTSVLFYFYLHMTIVLLDEYHEKLCGKTLKMFQDVWLKCLPFQRTEKSLVDQAYYLVS